MDKSTNKIDQYKDIKHIDKLKQSQCARNCHWRSYLWDDLGTGHYLYRGRSKLFYCSSVWSSTSLGNIHKLQLLQHFAARIISGVRKYDHITPILKNLGWLSVKAQLYLRDATLAYKCMTINLLLGDKHHTGLHVTHN